MPVREQTSDSLRRGRSGGSGYSRQGKRTIYMTSQQLNPIFPTLKSAESPWEFAQLW